MVYWLTLGRRHLASLELEKLGVDGFHLHVDRIAKSAIWGTDFDVHLHHEGRKIQGD